MDKVYIVSSTNEVVGYEQNDILTVFSTKEKAKEFIQQEKERIVKEIDKYCNTYDVIEDNETYYFIATEDQAEWYEIILIEKELN